MRSSVPYLLALLILVPPPASADDFPVPPGSRRNESLGGATTLAPGKNFTLTVYETPEPLDAVAHFYQQRLSVNPAREGGAIRFATGGGTVKLSPMEKGTRITLIVGPQ